MEFLSRVARGTEAVPVAPVGTATGVIATGAIATGATATGATDEAEAIAAGSTPAPAGGSVPASPAATDLPDDATHAVRWLSPAAIEANPYQPRRNFSPQEMEELAQSIREHGVLQPIIVRPLPEPHDGIAYQLVAGERRWRASQQAAVETVPAIVRGVSDQQALELALIENIQRHDISALDAAHAYRRLAEEFHLSQEKIAERVGKSRSGVANTMRLLELPAEFQQAIEEGRISEGHGRALLAVPGEGARRALFRRILRDNLSVRETERLAREAALPQETRAPAEPPAELLTAAELKDLEQRLQRSMSTRLHIKPKQKGGQIVLEYFSLEELDRLVELLLSTANARGAVKK